MKNVLTLLSVLLLSLALAQEGYPRTVTDGAGRELTFDAPPERVVALYNDNFGTLATLGVRPIGTLAGDEMLADPIYFEDGESIASVTSVDGEVDPEIIASLEPDLIMTSVEEEVPTLEGIAPVYLAGDLESLEDTIDELRRAATLFGLEDRAEEVIADFQDRLEAYSTLSPKNVSVMFTGVTPDEINVRTEASADCSLLDRIATCNWDDPTGGDSWSYSATSEAVLSLNPDVIIFGNWSGGDAENEVLFDRLGNDPLWQEIAAVQNDRVLVTPGYNNPIASSLPAATKILDTFAPKLYPEVFPEALSNKEVQEILAENE